MENVSPTNKVDLKTNQYIKYLLIFLFELIIITSSLFIGYRIGYYKSQYPEFEILNKNYGKTYPTPTPSFFQSSPKCKRYGGLPIEEILPTYTVKKGDTLLLISKNELNDPSRMNEIVELNKKYYPQLSLDKPFLEVGWSVYLPPNGTTKTTGKLERLAGKVKYKDASYLAVYFGEDGGAGGAQFPQGLYTHLSITDQLKIGDCIEMIYEGGKILEIKYQ